MFGNRILEMYAGLMLCFAAVGCSDAVDGEVVELGPVVESGGRGPSATQLGGDSETVDQPDSVPAFGDPDIAVEVDLAFEDVDSGGLDVPTDSSIGSSKACRDTVDADGLYSFRARSLTSGMDVSMCDYSGDALLIVNTAANCGFTPQYVGLEGLHRQYIHRPLTVLGFLSNDFGNQGGSLAEVEACTDQYMVTFEQFHHVGVTSTSRDGQHPLFQWLTTQPEHAGEIPWNFTKFLVSHDGRLLGRWDNLTTPDDRAFQSAVESAVSRAELWQR
ncbi:MAG: glutathione peroxidase [Myxococcota bacterium]|nr:glutathione peroxidase [Myxococcota bacterium]